MATRCLRLEPAPKILALSSTSHHEYSQRISGNGSIRLSHQRDTDREELIRAIRAVHRYQPFISAAIASRLALAKLNNSKTTLF